MKRLKVLSVASEIYPVIKTGGLADVAGALPAALASEDVTMATLVPGYPAVMAALEDPFAAHVIPDLFGAEARIVSGRGRGLDLFALDAPHLFDRPGNPYVGPDGQDWPDNPLRFAALSRAAAMIGTGGVPGFHPDIVHAHDWQAGLAAAYLEYGDGPRPGTVFTVHNLAFQGQVPASLLAVLGLPARAYAMDGVEYYSSIGYLKAGLRLSDRITTVSPSYAAEILTEAGGMGISGLLRSRVDVLSGILNGIDDAAWNPDADRLIAAQFDRHTLKRRRRNEAALRDRLGLTPNTQDAPLFGVVSRLTWQKGLDLLLASLPALLASGAQLALLGAGEPALEEGFRAAAAANPGRIGCVFGYDEALAHLIQAGSDALLVPSRFEPCGLTQLCALRYGAVPVVARAGGLADTVIDANEAALAAEVATGVQFDPDSAPALQAAIGRAVRLFRDGSWPRLQRNGMRTDVSWRRPAQHYAALYRDLVRERAA